MTRIESGILGNIGTKTHNSGQRRVTRGKFLKLGVKGVLGITAGLALLETSVLKGISAPLEQLEAYDRADIPSDQFLHENESFLRQTTLGCSFSPEKFMSLQDEHINPEQKQRQALNALKVITDTFGIKDIRLAIRWSNAVDKEGNFDFRFYKPFFDHCLKNGVNVCLNIGPIKTFRWPEEHIPQIVLEDLKEKIPQKSSIISPNDTIAQKGYKHLDSLFSFLKTNYSDEELSNINAIQPENEPFFPFGEYNWTSSVEYLEGIISKIQDYFPEKQILVNSSGAFDFARISTLFSRLIVENGFSPEKLALGIDYYHMIEDVAKKLEKISKTLENKLGWIDFITASKIFPWLFGDLNVIKNMSRQGVNVEITEAQVESWGRFTKPGNSLPDFQFVLIRCMDLLKPAYATQDKSLVRIWGIEKLAHLYMTGKLTEDQRGILKLTKAVNNLTEAA